MKTVSRSFQQGERVRGQYCGSDFTGTVTKCDFHSWHATRYTVRMDNPVDVCGAITHPAGTELILNYYFDVNRPSTNGFDPRSWMERHDETRHEQPGKAELIEILEHQLATLNAATSVHLPEGVTLDEAIMHTEEQLERLQSGEHHHRMMMVLLMDNPG